MLANSATRAMFGRSARVARRAPAFLARPAARTFLTRTPVRRARELSLVEELREIRVTDGKPVLSRNEDNGVAFPAFEAFDVDGTTVTLPPLMRSRVTLVGVSMRQLGAKNLQTWTSPFARRVHLSPRAIEHTGMLHISLVDNNFLRIFKKWLLKDLRKAETDLSLQRRSCLKIGDVADIRKTLDVTNRLVGYVFLLDHEGVIRWRGSGVATEPELADLFTTTLKLVEEREGGQPRLDDADDGPGSGVLYGLPDATTPEDHEHGGVRVDHAAEVDGESPPPRAGA